MLIYAIIFLFNLFYFLTKIFFSFFFVFLNSLSLGHNNVFVYNNNNKNNNINNNNTINNTTSTPTTTTIFSKNNTNHFNHYNNNSTSLGFSTATTGSLRNLAPNKSSLFSTNASTMTATTGGGGGGASSSSNGISNGGSPVSSASPSPPAKSPTPVVKPNHGKPNFAPKPPGLQQLAMASGQRPAVARHHSMRSPRYSFFCIITRNTTTKKIINNITYYSFEKHQTSGNAKHRFLRFRTEKYFIFFS